MRIEQLKAYSKQDLAEMAKKKGIRGWHAMSKDQLVGVLGGAAPSRNPSPRSTPAKRAAARNTRTSHNGTQEVMERSKFETGIAIKDLARRAPKDMPGGYGKDRIVVMVRDPYWLHAYWELTRTAIQRAEAALGQEWHAAKPILRVLDVSSEDTTSTAERQVRDIEIHGGVNN